MTLHLTFCEHADLPASDDQIRDAIRMLESGEAVLAAGKGPPRGHAALILAALLRRMVAP